jgi:hydroxypyruvate reductase
MSPLLFQDHPHHFHVVRGAALRAADPARAVREHLRLTDKALWAGPHEIPLARPARIWLIGLGKAAPAMSAAAVEILGDRLEAGIATVARHGPQGVTDPAAAVNLPRVEWVPAEHPTPGPGSLRAGQTAARLLAEAREGDLVVVLVSGGGSALIELPLPGIRLPDLQALTRRLLASGADISEINRVRRALSQIKAGGLARLAWPARVVALILSDVVGDRLSLVASGPTVLRGADPIAARRVLQRHGLWAGAPASVRRALTRGEPDRPPAHHPLNLLMGSNRHLVDAAAQAAAGLGFQVRIVSDRMQGEARSVGARFGARLRRATPGSCLIMGGETTVTVTGPGRGGRNQELALAAALALEQAPGRAVMAWASDGVDGPTDAAGAVVDGGLSARARQRGLDPQAALAGHDSYPLLQTVGALLRTGPTGTNLNDLVVGLSYAPD